MKKISFVMLMTWMNSYADYKASLVVLGLSWWKEIDYVDLFCSKMLVWSEDM